jgi:acetyl esterase/lipase
MIAAACVGLAACAGSGASTVETDPTEVADVAEPTLETIAQSLPVTSIAEETETTSTTALWPVATGVDYGAEAVDGSPEAPVLDVYAPDGAHAGGAAVPVMVVLHGQPDGRTITSRLSAELAARGNVVFNADWQFNPSTNTSGGNYHAACAIRFARQTAEQYGGDPDDVVVVGYSAGGVLAATMALNGDAASGRCSNDEALSATPDAMIGLAGTYDVYGAQSPTDAGEATGWLAFNPYEQLAMAEGLDALLIHGRSDQIVPISTTENFAAALDANGASVSTTYLDGADHFIVFDPWLVGVGDEVERWMADR